MQLAELMLVWLLFICAAAELEIVQQYVVNTASQENWNFITAVMSEEYQDHVRFWKTLMVLTPTAIHTVHQNDSLDDLPHKSREQRLQFVVFWEANNIGLKLFMQKAAIRGWFTNNQNWLAVLPNDVSMAQFIKEIEDLPIYIDSDLICVQKVSLEWLKLTEVWSPGRNHSFLTADFGRWGTGVGLVRSKPLVHKYDRRRDLRGVLLVVSTIITMPYENLTVDNTLQNFDQGYVVDVWHGLQEQLNFSYRARDTLFGSLQADKVTWNGMVGDLQKEVSDAAVAPLSITLSRTLAIDFTYPIQMVSSRLYIKRPVLEASWSLYALPFDIWLWICVPWAIIVAGILIWALNVVALRFAVTDNEFTVSEAVWMVFVGIVQQGADRIPSPISGKLMLLTGLMFSVVLYTCYSGVLVSILATLVPRLPFSDFEGIVSRPDWNLGVRTNTALSDSLALSPSGSPMRLAWQKNVLKNPRKDLVDSNQDGISNVLKGKFAFFANKEFITYLLQTELPLDQATDVIDTGVDFLVRSIGFGLQKNSPYKEIFNYYLAKMLETGQMNRLRRKWWPKIKREPPLSWPSPGVKEVFTVFIILGIGFFTSGILLALENLLNRRRQKCGMIIFWTI